MWAQMKPIRHCDLLEQKNCIDVTQSLAAMTDHPDWHNTVNRLHAHTASFVDVVSDSKCRASSILCAIMMLVIFLSLLLILVYKSFLIWVADGIDVLLQTNYILLAGILIMCVFAVTIVLLKTHKTHTRAAVQFRM